MQSLFNLIYTIIQLYIFVIIAAAIMSWLVAFNVLNTQNRFVAIVYDMMNRLTEPGLRPIRRILPNLGGIDISPVILILLLIFLQNLLLEYFIRPGAIAHF
jgi:YggT family protein